MPYKILYLLLLTALASCSKIEEKVLESKQASERASFEPTGKTEQEIIACWKQPVSRMEVGEETYLSYPEGTVVVKDGRAVRFDKEMVAKSKTEAAKEDAQKKDASRSNDLAERVNYMNKLKSEIKYKTDEFNALVNMKQQMENQPIGYRADSGILMSYNPDTRKMESKVMKMPEISSRISDLTRELSTLNEELKTKQTQMRE